MSTPRPAICSRFRTPIFSLTSWKEFSTRFCICSSTVWHPQARIVNQNHRQTARTRRPDLTELRQKRSPCLQRNKWRIEQRAWCSMSSQNLSEFQKKLGYFFRDLSLLRMSLTHPSVAHEQGPGVTVYHNQRLEFLGDAVLQLVLTRELYTKFPAYGEGPLTKARAQLVNRRMLAEHGKRLNLGQYLQLSRGEESSGGRERPSSLDRKSVV